MTRERSAERREERRDGSPEPVGGRWLTIHEACAFLGVDQSTLRRWSDSGKVPVFRSRVDIAATPSRIRGRSSAAAHGCRSATASPIRR